MAETKHRVLFEELKAALLSGEYGHGERLPSESELVSRTGFSRITVSRALRDLDSAGLVRRVAGSGTFAVGPGDLSGKAFLFGLLMPELGKTEIFAPLCRAIADAPAAKTHALLWGSTGAGSAAQQLSSLARQSIERGVDGVFFAPAEFGPDADTLNRRIFRMLTRANIAVVLLDRRVSGLSSRTRPDLAALNHTHAAELATRCLLQTGCTRLAFITRASAAESVAQRREGFLRTVAGNGSKAKAVIFDIESGTTRLRRWMSVRNSGVVCVNDGVAGSVLALANAEGIDVPGSLQIVGIDDAGYAGMLTTPLTTIRQPLAEIGVTALRLMVERLQSPSRAGREVLLDGQLIQRSSTKQVKARVLISTLEH